jgi:hypothetical protein
MNAVAYIFISFLCQNLTLVFFSHRQYVSAWSWEVNGRDAVVFGVVVDAGFKKFG